MSDLKRHVDKLDGTVVPGSVFGMLGVAKGTIGDVLRRRTWAHVPEPDRVLALRDRLRGGGV